LNLVCKLVGHRRSKKGVRRRGEEWLSKCAICSEPMTRTLTGEWVVGKHELKP